MTKAVLTTKVSPVYDDLPEHRYHFPKTYLNQASKAVGDWIVYYEPRRYTGDLASFGGRQLYFATARIDRIVPDPVVASQVDRESCRSFYQGLRPFTTRMGRSFYLR